MSLNPSLQGTFNGAEVVVIFGPLHISGMSDGESVVANRNEPMYNSRAGMEGGVGRAKVTDKRGTIELHIMQTSPMNDRLAALLNLDSISQEGELVAPMIVRDLSGTTVIAASSAWFNILGSVGFEAGAVGERVYTFECADLTIWPGGNK